MQTIARSIAGSCLFLALISAGTVFSRLGALPFIGADEPRYARIAEEMHTERRWVTPVLEGHPWLEKPPLYYWLTIPLIGLFGAGEAPARLGPALLAFFCALAIFWLGSKLRTCLVGLLAGTILLSSLGFCAFSRSASTDMPMTCCVTIALALLTAAVADPHFARWKVWCGYVFLGLALLAKGPVAAVLVAGIVAAFWFVDERGGSLGRLSVVPGLLIAACVSIPWFWLAFRENGFSFVLVYFVNHNLARYVSDIHHHSESFYYFGPVLLGFLFPWSGWMLLLVPEHLREVLRKWREWRRETLFLMCWSLFPLLFFSLSRSKLPGYILPILPPLALVMADRLAGLVNAPKQSGLIHAAPWFYLVFSIGGAVASPIIFDRFYGGSWRVGLTLSAAMLVPALFAWDAARRGKWGRALHGTLAQGVLLVLAAVVFVYPVLGQYHSTKGVAQELLSARQDDEPLVTYRFFHHTLYYYTGYRIADDLVDKEALLRFAMAHSRFLVVAETFRAAELEELPGFSARMLGRQGKLCVLRIAHQ